MRKADYQPAVMISEAMHFERREVIMSFIIRWRLSLDGVIHKQVV